MGNWIGASLLVLGFTALIQPLGLIKNGGKVVPIALDSLETISSLSLNDEEKEKKLQKNSIKLFGLFFLILVGGVISLSLPLVVVWALDYAGWLSLSGVLDITVSPLFLLLSVLYVLILIYLKYKFPSEAASPINDYSDLDQTLHKIAFKTYPIQIQLANLEDKILSKSLADCHIDRPVFITALPRAGTTLLLECCSSLPEFATHRYRDMPFILLPYLWNRYSQAFQKNIKPQERAHGDGIRISPDSPEAFEEIIWLNFWQEQYQENQIIPWCDTQVKPEFQKFFHSHISKVILLRRQRLGNNTRYISKNNANIARTQLLKVLFPDSIIVVPVRSPFDHAASLLQQHLNFLDIHQKDAFALEYMRAIGHYDFGQNLCPLNFDGWLDHEQAKDRKSLAFWLEYWLATYTYLLNHQEQGMHFFNYDNLCENPQQGLNSLAQILEIDNLELLGSKASQIRAPRPKSIDMNTLHKPLLEDVSSLYENLKSACIN